MTEFEKESIKTAELRQLIKIDDLKMRQFDFKPADRIADYFSALKLVQDVYIEEGYVNADEASCPCRILENHFFEKTAVFIGKQNENLAFTVSLFPDSPSGLPMDSIYKKELDHLRAQGRMIGEVGCLATHPEFRDGSQNILMHGNKIMLKYAMEHLHLDDLVITVNPKHVLVYKEVLLFDEIGEEKIKAYPKVNGNPAVALRLNLHEVEEKCRHFYQNNSLNTNLHHFLFVEHSSILQLPENNEVMCNNFARFFTPPIQNGTQDIFRPDDRVRHNFLETVH
jgi:hypothetical protein